MQIDNPERAHSISTHSGINGPGGKFRPGSGVIREHRKRTNNLDVTQRQKNLP